MVHEGRDLLGVARHREVVQMSLDDSSKPSPRLPDRVMQAIPQFLFGCLQGRAHAGALSVACEYELAFPVVPTDMREAKEVEGFRLSLPSLSPVSCRESSEFDHSGPSRMRC